MALAFPREFPEPYSLPVLAAEAQARIGLEAELKSVGWRDLGRNVDQAACNATVLKFLNCVCGAFAAQACIAVGDRAMKAAVLDAVVERFVESAQRHLFELGHDKVVRNRQWPTVTDFVKGTRVPVLTAEWHTEYLARVPSLFPEPP